MELIPTMEQMQSFRCRSEALSRRLTQAGVAFVGLAQDRIDFADGVSQELRDYANLTLAGWDWNAPPVPTRVTATQAKRALILSSLYEAIDQWISVAETEPGGYTYRVVWDARYWYRRSPELNEIDETMGLT